MNPDAIQSISNELKQKLEGIVRLQRALDILRLDSNEYSEFSIQLYVRTKTGQQQKVTEMPLIETDHTTNKLTANKLIGSDAIILGLKKRIDRGIDLREAEAETLRQRMQRAWK